MQKTIIQLSSTDHQKLDEVCSQIKELAKKRGVRIAGPIPLPTKRLRVPVRKGPSGQGTATWDKWEMRIHKRLIVLHDPDERTLKQIMRIRIPEEIFIEMSLK
ncbi:MAG: 30S ribosomal protein S10 [Candidatus Jordarchaeales archaeon]|nr:30S ribosomal protein S10 [Candidatus Jordarchaeia archaeon]